MKQVCIAIMCALSLCACANDGKQIISLGQLPQAAQSTIATYAASEPIAVVVMDKDLLETDYEVRFQNGNEWKFDENGLVESLDNHINALPTALIPSAIVQYVNQAFPGQYIMEYNVDRREYEITLSSGVELTFNKAFELIKTDID